MLGVTMCSRWLGNNTISPALGRNKKFICIMYISLFVAHSHCIMEQVIPKDGFWNTISPAPSALST